MQLSELTVRGFADLLGSDAPAPGGGSAAALAGAAAVQRPLWARPAWPWAIWWAA